MVRTSRSAATTTAPASMDDIDLDVMFAADGDALFDGLDIDLDMDDIAGAAGGGNSSAGALDASNRSNTSSQNRRIVKRPQTQRPKSPDDENGEDELSRTRRKTKRKAKTPSFFEDDDDDYDGAPASKRKRKASTNSKAAGVVALTKKKSAAKISQDDTSMTTTKPPTSIPKAKSKSTKSLSSGMPPPLARTGPWLSSSSSSNGAQNVAAAGQFGSRQKQRMSGTSFPSLPKGGGAPAAGAVSSNQGGRIINKLPLSRSVGEASTKSKSSTQQQHQQQHKRLVLQPESTYCGLQPSPAHFYPFMPSLPSEPVLKSRKVYGSIDRIHTSLVGYLHTPPTTSSGIVQAKENEPIYILLQEAFKEEKSGASPRSDSIGISIGELRQTITTMDKNRIISDWYGVCALIKRQHDFLKQNCENMERWCRDNFSKEDFAEVYTPSKKRKDIEGTAALSLLKTFKKREIKVKISFTGLKDPKMSAYVLAVFPPSFLTNEVTVADETESKHTAHVKKKAQPASSSTSLHDGKATDLNSPNSKIKPPQPLSYANMKPPRRRRNVAEMITRTARELSKTNASQIENSRNLIGCHEAELEKVLSQNSTCGINTAAMWEWVELSGFFNDFCMKEVEDNLRDIRSIKMTVNDDIVNKQSVQMPLLSNPRGNSNIADVPVYERLQSLLVDVQSLDDDENDCNDAKIYLSDESIHEVCSTLDFIDMASFTIEERACIVLRSFGFSDIDTVESVSYPAKSVISGSRSGKEDYDDKGVLNGKEPMRKTIESESVALDDIICAMKSELSYVEKTNDGRVAYLESVSSQYRRSKKDKLLHNEREASLIAKCQQLLRKSKENKAKNGATTRKDDSLALPW